MKHNLTEQRRPWKTKVEYSIAAARERGDVPEGKLSSIDHGDTHESGEEKV